MIAFKINIDEDDIAALLNTKLLKENNFEETFSEKYRDALDLKDDIKVFLVAYDGYITMSIIFEDSYGVHCTSEEAESYHYSFGMLTEKAVLKDLEEYVLQLIKGAQ